MTLLLRDLTLDISTDEDLLASEAARQLGVEVKALKGFRIVRRSIDARKKNRIHKKYAVEFSFADEASLLEKHGKGRLEKLPEAPEVMLPRVNSAHHALVVGTGPAGLFAAKRLVESGVRVTLVDRGRSLEQRVKDVENFWASGQFDAISNVQFGEGGAGTFF